MLNLAIFLGANFFSENIFFLLDEMDQNMDPASTMMGKQILDRFSQEKQVLLLTPGKDPAMLQDANLIMIDERDDGVSLKHLTNVEMHEMEAKANT